MTRNGFEGESRGPERETTATREGSVMTSRRRVLTGSWLFSLLAPFLGLMLAGCGGDGEPDEPPGRSGINFDLRSDEVGNLHVVYRGYAQGDLKQPDGWTRV